LQVAGWKVGRLESFGKDLFGKRLKVGRDKFKAHKV